MTTKTRLEIEAAVDDEYPENMIEWQIYIGPAENLFKTKTREKVYRTAAASCVADKTKATSTILATR